MTKSKSKRPTRDTKRQKRKTLLRRGEQKRGIR